MSDPKGLSPTTGQLIKGYKEPLVKISGGYGFYGALAHDQSERYTQCHICGWFFKGLAMHIRQAHDLERADYKARFGLSQRTSLTAPKQKTFLTEARGGLEVLTQLAEEGRSHINGETYAKAGATKISLIQRNKQGRCPEQTLERVALLKSKLDKQPTQREFIAEYGWGPFKTLKTLFGTWSNAVREVAQT